MNENTLRANLLKSGVNLRYKFLYGDSEVDYTDLVLDIPMIHRDVNLSAGIVPVKLNNAGGWFNFLKATNTALGEVGKIQVYVQGDTTNILTLFSGVVKDTIYNGATVIIYLKDIASAWLEKKVGSNASPHSYWQSQSWDADTMVWRLLTHA